MNAKKQFLAGLAIQAAVGLIGCGAGSYVAVAVLQNDIGWIKTIQQNHERRIEALEEHEERPVALNERVLPRFARLPFEVHEPLTIERPGFKVFAGPGDPLWGH